MPSSDTRAVMSPLRPTMSLMRPSSFAIRSFRDATSLNADTMSAMSGCRDRGKSNLEVAAAQIAQAGEQAHSGLPA